MEGLKKRNVICDNTAKIVKAPIQRAASCMGLVRQGASGKQYIARKVGNRPSWKRCNTKICSSTLLYREAKEKGKRFQNRGGFYNYASPKVAMKNRLTSLKRKAAKEAAKRKRLEKRIETAEKKVSSFREKADMETDFRKANRHTRKANKFQKQVDKMGDAFMAAKKMHEKYQADYDTYEELYEEQAIAVEKAKVATKKANAPNATQADVARAEQLNEKAVEAIAAIQYVTPAPSSPAPAPKTPIKKRKRLTEAERLMQK